MFWSSLFVAVIVEPLFNNLRCSCCGTKTMATTEMMLQVHVHGLSTGAVPDLL